MERFFVEAFPVDDYRKKIVLHNAIESDGLWSLFAGYDLLNSENFTFIQTITQLESIVTLSFDPNRRIYFSLKNEKGKTILFGERILPIAGMFNFRDMGGYPTEDGRRIKWGKLYRSDHLYNLKDTSWEYVKNLGLHTIIDFRSNDEISKYPNRIPDPSTISYVCSPDAVVAAFAGSLQNLNEELGISDEQSLEKMRKEVHANPNIANEKMIKQQLQFVEGDSAQKAYRSFLKILANPSTPPSVEHCKGGKDRTGYGAMLLEWILGVCKEDLIYDYMLTKKAREHKNKLYYERFLKSTGDPKLAQHMYSFFDTKEEYIEAAINKIKENYQSATLYAKDILGITDDEILSLKELYLE